MLRVGYYLNSNAIGGLERHVLTLIERLRGVHHIEVFCDDVPGVESFREDLAAIDIAPRLMRAHTGSTRGVVGPMMAGLPVALATRNALKAARLDLIHFHAGQLGLMYAPVVAACAAGIATRDVKLHHPIFRHSRVRPRRPPLAVRWRAACAGVVLPSRGEAQSISLLEARACRKPVVAADVGGVPEVVADGVTGLLYPGGNVDALAAALLALLDDDARREAMGAAGRQRVAERFSRQAMLRPSL